MDCSIAAPKVQATPAAEVSLRRNFGWTAAGNATYALCQWAIVSLLAKLSSVEIVGQYALGLAVTTPIFMLAQLNLRSVLSTDVSSGHPFRDYRHLRFVSLVIALVATFGVAAFGYSGSESRIVAVMGLLQFADWSSDIYYGLLQQQEQMNRIAVSMMMRGAASLAALALALFVTHDLAISLSVVLLCRAGIFILYDSTFAVREFVPDPGSPRRFHWNSQAALLRTALPLGFVMMAGSLWINIPRYFITHELNTYALGIFAALASLTSAGNMVMNAMGQAATPRLAKLFAARDLKSFQRVSAGLVFMGTSLGAAGVAVALTVGQRLLAILFRPEYAEHSALLAVLCAGAGLSFVASGLGYAITAARRFREQIPIQIAATAASAVTAYFLVPSMGLTGAALALAAAPLAQALGELYVLRFALREAGMAAA